MQSLSSFRTYRAARTLALLALLAVAALQVQEAAHSHAPDHALEHCLVCKSSADTALPSSTAEPVSLGHREGPTSAPRARFERPFFPHFLARGPPAASEQRLDQVS